MANNKKITELESAIPTSEFNFVAATNTENYRVTLSNLASAILPDDLGSSADIDALEGALDQLDDRINLIIGEDGEVQDGFISSIAPKFPDSFVFFHDISNNAGSTFYEFYKTPTSDTHLSGIYVESADNLKASIRWDGPLDHYMGTGYINDIEIPLGNIIELGDKTRRFEGFIDNFNLVGDTVITGSANGSTGYAKIIELGPGPTAHDISIDSIINSTPAPGTLLGTDDLKEGDVININVIYKVDDYLYDLQIPHSIEVHDENLAKQSIHTNLNWQPAGTLGAGYSGLSLPVTVSNRDGLQGVCLSATNRAGIVGAKDCSTDFQGANRSRNVDNTTPVITFESVDYPNGQEAIKSNESATVNHTVSDANEYEYRSDNGELDINSIAVFEAAKNAQYLAGGYNITQNNFTLKATRTTNGIYVENSTIVNIANEPLALATTLPAAIKSGPNPGEDHSFTLLSTQKFLQVPTLSLDATQNPISTLNNTDNGTDEDSNKYRLTVIDGDEKGLFSWGVIAVNLAGITTTNVSDDYNIQGFTERVITANPQDLAQGLASLGVAVGDPNNITFENLSKGGSGPNGGTMYTYLFIADDVQLDFSFDNENRFTACDSSGLTLSQGDHLFNLDKLSRDANVDVNKPSQFVVSED
jgi:hypothetical protein